MASPGYRVSSIGTLFSLISSHAPVLCLRPLSAACFHTVHDQAPGNTSRLSFVSDVAVFPNPLLLRHCGFDLFRPSAEGLAEQWLNAGHTQERLWVRAAANVQRIWPGASLPQKKFTRPCSSNVSGIMENHSTHLSPGSPLRTLFHYQRMWLFSQVHCGLAFGAPTQPLPGVLPAGELPLPMWPEEPQTPLCFWGFTFPTRALPRIELQSFRLCAPPVCCLNGI